MASKVSFDDSLPAGNGNSTLTSKSSSSALVSKEKISAYYQKYCSLLKAFLLQYLGYISSPGRQEAILKTTQYTLWLLSRLYPKGTFVHSLEAISGELSWARYILRFFGLPAALEGVDSGSWASDCKTLGKAMAWTMIAYYPLEHVAYLSWKAPQTRWIPSSGAVTRWNPFGTSQAASNNSNTCSSSELMTSSQIGAKASAWSCRFWFAYLVLDIARSMLALKKVQQQQTDGDEKKNAGMNGDATEDNHALTPAETSLVRTERLQLVRNFLYLLPAIHWSLPNWDTKPWLSNDVVNGLCWLEAVVGMYQGIRSFRDS